MKNVQLRKGLLLLLSLLLIAVFSSSCAKSNNTATGDTADNKEKKKVTLRLVLGQPAGDEVTVADEEMAKRFNERAASYGYELKIYPGGTLGQVPEFLDSVRTGAVEMMNSSPPIFSGADSKLSAYGLPFLYKNSKAVAASMDDLQALYNPLFQEKFNQHILAFMYTGSANIFTSKKEIKAFSDLKGILLGATDPTEADIAALLGAVPITLAWTDFYTSLDKGVIEGITFVPNGVIAMKMTDKLKHYLDLDITGTGNVYSINLDVWKAMPKEVQDILSEEAKKRAKEGSEKFVADHVKHLEIMKSLGLTITEIPDSERKLFEEACVDYNKERLAKLGDFGDKILEIVNKANASN